MNSIGRQIIELEFVYRVNIHSSSPHNSGLAEIIKTVKGGAEVAASRVFPKFIHIQLLTVECPTYVDHGRGAKIQRSAQSEGFKSI